MTVSPAELHELLHRCKQRCGLSYQELDALACVCEELTALRSPAHPSEAGELHELADRLNHTVIAVNPDYKGALDEINTALSTPPEADKKLAEDAALIAAIKALERSQIGVQHKSGCSAIFGMDRDCHCGAVEARTAIESFHRRRRNES